MNDEKFVVKSSIGSLLVFQILLGSVTLLYIIDWILHPERNPSPGFYVIFSFQVISFVLIKGCLIKYENGKIYFRYLFIFKKVIDINKILYTETDDYYAINIYTMENGKKKKITLPLKVFTLEGVGKLLEILPEPRPFKLK